MLDEQKKLMKPNLCVDSVISYLKTLLYSYLLSVSKIVVNLLKNVVNCVQYQTKPIEILYYDKIILLKRGKTKKFTLFTKNLK